MSEILISSWWKNPCWQSQRSDVSCSWSLGLHTSQEGLWDTSHSLGRVFGVIVMLEYPSTTHFQCPDPDGTWPRPSSLWCGVVALSPLQIKHPQSIMFPPPCLTVGNGVLVVTGSITPPPNTASWVNAKELNFGLIWPQHLTQFSSESLTNFRRACTCAFLNRGTLQALQDFSFYGIVLPVVFLVTMVPAALRSLIRSFSIVLGWFLTVLVIIETPRGEISHGAPDRVRLTVILCFFYLWIIAPMLSPSH